jgi:hypothetical protein
MSLPDHDMVRIERIERISLIDSRLQSISGIH